MAYWPNLNSIEARQSFTLLETMVAIYVLLFGLASALGLASQSLSVVGTFKKQLIAANLAQEGEELIRNKRDSNFIGLLKSGCNPINNCDANTADENGILPTICAEPKGCRIDWDHLVNPNNPHDPQNPELTFVACDSPPPGDCQKLHEDDAPGASGLYGYHPSWSLTDFDRRITVSESTSRGTNLNDLHVISTVRWNDRFLGSNAKIVVETYLTPNLYY